MPYDPDGTIADMGAFYYPDPTDVDDLDESTLPHQYEIAQNYPNPFNPVTTIEYTLSRHGNVRIDIFNLIDQEVRTLVDREQSAGSYSISWDGKTNSGRPAATGIYFYRIGSSPSKDT